LSLRGRLDYESVLFASRAEAKAREQFTFGRVDRRISPYVVSHLAGSYLDAPDLFKHAAASHDDTEAQNFRLRDFLRNLQGENERIRRAAAEKIVPPDFVLERTLVRMYEQRERLTKEQTLSDLHTQAIGGMSEQITLLESLRGVAAKAAAPDRLKNCEGCYAAALRAGAATEPNVEEFRRQGLAEAHALNARTDTLLKKVGLRRGSVEQRLRMLANDDRYLYPDSDAGKDRAVTDMNARLRTILPALQPLFKSPIASNIEVRRLTRDEELAGKVGYRVAPSADGTRPGIYFVDLHAVRERPTWSLPTVTYHETLPGHLLQVPLQNAAKLHPLRQQLNARGYLEGWAIYAETLAQEIGVYHEDPLSEIGYLQSRLFRVARLLVDIGIHAAGWSRDRAIDELMQMTAQPRALCEFDVERYFVLPGMFAADELGYYGWRAARTQALRTRLPRNELAAFHDQGLKFGPAPMSVLATVLFPKH
jgi:uncharacterized protein (DUF885 family)